jgi:hypothetical protein
VTHIRLRGILPRSIVQADAQVPSITTLSPDARSLSSFCRYSPIWPPGSSDILTSAIAGTKVIASQNMIDTARGPIDAILAERGI